MYTLEIVREKDERDYYCLHNYSLSVIVTRTHSCTHTYNGDSSFY